jgi:hypothetical protein
METVMSAPPETEAGPAEAAPIHLSRPALRRERGGVLRLSVRRAAATGHPAGHPVPRDRANPRLCRPPDRSLRRQALRSARRGCLHAARTIICGRGDAGRLWSIASVGPRRAGMSMSWTGIAMYAALAMGAPLGMLLYQAYGPQAAMVACIVAPLAAAAIAVRATRYTSPTGRRLPFYRVIGQIWREGLGLMLQGVGLSGLTAFASLYFAARGWGHAGFIMTAFGSGYIFVRLVLGHLPDKIGGYRVALGSLAIEAIGQALIWSASHELVALGGALVTGFGCALVFPRSVWRRSSGYRRPTEVARWGHSSPLSTSLTALPVLRRVWWPACSATPRYTCWAPPVRFLAPHSSQPPAPPNPDV